MAIWRTIQWTLQYEVLDERPVWVSVQKIEEQWKSHIGEYISIGGSGNSIDNRYETVGNWLRVQCTIWMPTISLEEGDLLCFTDGRHRFSWIRDHQAEALQVAVPAEQVEAFTHRFGTTNRISRWMDTSERNAL